MRHGDRHRVHHLIVSPMSPWLPVILSPVQSVVMVDGRDAGEGDQRSPMTGKDVSLCGFTNSSHSELLQVTELGLYYATDTTVGLVWSLVPGNDVYLYFGHAFTVLASPSISLIIGSHPSRSLAREISNLTSCSSPGLSGPY